MTIPFGTYTLPSGTYTNYRTRFVGISTVTLSGNYVFNGDTAIEVAGGSIDTSAATITVNYGGASRKLVLAAPNGFVTVGQITATDSDVYLHALGNDPTEMGTVRTVANGDIFTPTVAARGIYLWAKPRLSSTTDTAFDTISMTRSVSVTPTAGYIQAMGSPFGLVVSDSGPTYTAYNVMSSGRLYRSCYSVPPGTDVGRSTNISATSYQIVSTDQTVGSAISMLDIVQEFNSFPLGDIMTIATVVAPGGPFYRFTPRTQYAALTFTNNDIIFADDFATNESRWGIIVGQTFSGSPAVTQSLVVDWRQVDANGNRVAPNNMVGALARVWRQADGPMSLDRYYSGGSYVPSGTVGFPNGVSTVIPTSGPISLANFYGSTRFILQEYVFSAAGAGQVRSQDLPAGTWNILVNLQGAGGGGGGGPDRNNADVGGVGAAAQMRFTISSATTQRITIYGANGGAGGGVGFGAGYNGGGGVAAAAFSPASFDPNVAAMFGGRDGGASGNIGASGGGGGGGGAVVIGWKPNINSGAYETLLGLAGGGGGGGGAGRYVYSSGPNSVAAGSWTVRGLTVDLATFLLLQAQNSGWANGNGYPANKRAGYQNEGQGTYTMTAFYPPGDDGWSGSWDGGAGGGGGGGNGFGGGLAGSANNATIWSQPVNKDSSVGPWNPPYEGMGGGGGQGFIYADLNTYASFSIDYNNASQGLGVYGLGGALNGGAGTSGYIAVKITNLMSDRAFP